MNACASDPCVGTHGQQSREPHRAAGVRGSNALNEELAPSGSISAKTAPEDPSDEEARNPFLSGSAGGAPHMAAEPGPSDGFQVPLGSGEKDTQSRFKSRNRRTVTSLVKCE